MTATISKKRILTLNPAPIIKEFFEVYLLTEIYDWSKNQILNSKTHEVIEREFERKVSSFCNCIQIEAEASIKRELNHFTGDDGADMEWVENNEEVHNKLCSIINDKKIKLEEKLFIFTHPGWDVCYGGDCWKQAAALWMGIKKAKTTRERFGWADRLLDHEHHSGNFLNKTYFFPITKGILAYRQRMPSALVVKHLCKVPCIPLYERSLTPHFRWKINNFPHFQMKDFLVLLRRTVDYSFWGTAAIDNNYIKNIKDSDSLAVEQYSEYLKLTK